METLKTIRAEALFQFLNCWTPGWPFSGGGGARQMSQALKTCPPPSFQGFSYVVGVPPCAPKSPAPFEHFEAPARAPTPSSSKRQILAGCPLRPPLSAAEAFPPTTAVAGQPPGQLVEGSPGERPGVRTQNCGKEQQTAENILKYRRLERATSRKQNAILKRPSFGVVDLLAQGPRGRLGQFSPLVALKKACEELSDRSRI